MLGFTLLISAIIRTERIGDSGLSDLTLNLLSGLLGGLVGAFATLRAAQWQLREMAKTHAAALAQQNEILEQTFRHQHELLSAEQKLKTQLEVLTRLHDVLQDVMRPVYLDGHQLRNDWAGQIIGAGLEQYVRAVLEFRSRASDAIREFAAVLNSCRHLPDVYSAFDNTLKFQAKFFEPIQLFVGALEKLTANPDRGMISLVDANGRAFSDSVNELSSWIDDCINLTFAMKIKLLDFSPNTP